MLGLDVARHVTLQCRVYLKKGY